MYKVFSIAIVIMAAMIGVSAQVRQDRIKYSEDKSVTLKLGLSGPTEAIYPGTSYSYSVDDFKPGVVRVGPRTTYLKEGLSTDEVVRLLGKPTSISERSEQDVVITVYEFRRGEGHFLLAEFVGGVLLRSWSETRDAEPVQADR
jgi:hypothetical protein